MDAGIYEALGDRENMFRSICDGLRYSYCNYELYYILGYANEYVLCLDGDLVIHPEDMVKVLECSHEFVGGGTPVTEDPWLLQTYMQDNREFVSAFSHTEGTWEWNGIAQMKSYKMQKGRGHVFRSIEPYLPVPFMNIRTREIDTVGDYKQAVAWVRNIFQ